MLTNFVFKNVLQFLDATALIYQEKKITYRQLLAGIQHTTTILKLRIKKKDPVLIFLPNCPQFIFSFFAVLNLKGIVVLSDIKWEQEILYVLKKNEAKTIITNPAGKEKINKILKNAGEDTQKYSFPCFSLEEIPFSTYNLNPSLFKKYLKTDAEMSEVAMVLYTSGSTSDPKGVINTEESLIEALKNYRNTLPIDNNDKLVAVVPFFHSYAFNSCFLSGLNAGATLILEEIFQPRKILNIITQEKATIFHGVPYMYQLLLHCYDHEKYSVESIRYFVSAGAKLKKEVFTEFHNFRTPDSVTTIRA